MMYVHGFTNTPGVVFDAVEAMNEYYKGKDVFVIPICWPAERVNYFGQKEDAPGAANALRSLVPGVMSATTPISVMCHSMGNYVLKKMAPETESEFRFDNIFMVASDVRATTFDVKKGYCKVEDGKGKKDYDHDGEDGDEATRT